jgi:hypothetical protein
MANTIEVHKTTISLEIGRNFPKLQNAPPTSLEGRSAVYCTQIELFVGGSSKTNLWCGIINYHNLGMSQLKSTDLFNDISLLIEQCQRNLAIHANSTLTTPLAIQLSWSHFIELFPLNWVKDSPLWKGKKE